ncbi:unnamed protein product, partial [marine sediment metagenome]
MTKKDDRACIYCCFCLGFIIVIGLVVKYWYIAIPFVLIPVGVYLLIILMKEKSKENRREIILLKQYHQENYKKWITPKPKYPPNCVNCNMPIKEYEDLTYINRKLRCKYCGHVRLNTDELYEIELRKIYGTSNKKKETRSRHISAQV